MLRLSLDRMLLQVGEADAWMLLALPGLVRRKINTFVLDRVWISEELGRFTQLGMVFLSTTCTEY